MLCFQKRLIESLVFLLISHYPAPSHWVKGNRTELCRRDNNIKLAHHITSGMAAAVTTLASRRNGTGRVLCLNLLVALTKHLWFILKCKYFVLERACHFICFKDKVKNWPSSFVLQIIQNTAKYIKSLPPTDRQFRIEFTYFLLNSQLFLPTTESYSPDLKHSEILFPVLYL